MTRLERKEQELEKLYEYRAAAIKMNNLMWLQRNQDRIDVLEKEVIELRKNHADTVFSVLSDKPEMIRDEVYKSLLRISLMADACNEACEMCREKLAKHGIVSFSFQDDVRKLCELSQKIASVTLRSKNKILEDFIVNNDTFVKMCIKHADAHIKRTLHL